MRLEGASVGFISFGGVEALVTRSGKVVAVDPDNCLLGFMRQPSVWWKTRWPAAFIVCNGQLCE